MAVSSRDSPARKALAACLLVSLVTGTAASDEPELWSLRPVSKPDVPRADSDTWSRTDIDRFLHRGWADAGLAPSGDADAETLARRLFFNLAGLPPTLDELDQFLSEHSTDPNAAMEAVVDRLLASPRFGEKWARHWLDLARYAESNGKDRDIVFPEAWRYRDYVIDSFNADKPIDLFFREQIAGDLLPGAGDEQHIATAFLALGPKAFQETDTEKFRMDLVDEQIDVTTRAMLGLSVACARCHDHKFDPVLARDYYAMAGIFLSSDTRYGPGPLYAPKHDKDTGLVPLGEGSRERHEAVAKWRAGIIEIVEKTTSLRSAAYRIQREITGALRERGLKKAEEDPELAEKEKKMLAMREEADALDEKRIRLTETPPGESPGYTMAVLRGEKKPEDCAVRLGGVPGDRGEVVARGGIAVPGLPDLEAIADTESGRRQLADWIASERNPLTARVFVNRAWHHLFGRGLVASVDNFGTMGEAPSHPELLDHLAAEFVADGWSLKNLVRRIVLSRTWQLSSRPDPANDAIDSDNRLFWRANFRRLEIEAFRDAMLLVSGRLDLSPPEGSLFRHVYAGKEYGVASSNRVNFDAEIAADVHRTVYLPVARNSLPGYLALFDFADPTAPVGARNARTIPAQALYLMNNPFVEEQAAAAGERLLALPEKDRFAAAARLTTGRPPSPAAEEAMREWVAGREDDPYAWTDLVQALFASAAFRYLE